MRSDESLESAYPDLGKVTLATQVITSELSQARVRNIILLLAASVALMMTGFGIIMPVFARRLTELGSGVETMGWMTMSFALAQFVAAPAMGSLADRIGRRPLVLIALAAYVATNIGYLLALSPGAFILIRAAGGLFTAGLFPAVMGIVVDLIPEERRARWVGVVMGSYGAGLVFGPVVGGILYDGWGFAAPFVASAVMAGIALVGAAIQVPETRTRETRWREELEHRRTAKEPSAQAEGIRESLPRPLYLFGMLLFLDFISSFSLAFVEPQMVFYVYDELGWSTVQFGLIVGTYGLAMMLGQIGLGQMSDKYGRKPVIVAGVLLNATLYTGMVYITSFSLMMPVSILAGLGAALAAPALSVFYLDITPKQHRSRVVGIKGSAASLGGVAGPLLVAVISDFTTPKGIFGIAGVFMIAGAALAFILLREPHHAAKQMDGLAWEVSHKRSMAAQASLRGIVLRATVARRARTVS